MSSAALQSPAGLQPPSRHYPSSHSSSPTREASYHASPHQQQAATASPSSSSRPSRKSSAAGHGSATNITSNNYINASGSSSGSSGALHASSNTNTANNHGSNAAPMSHTNSPMSSRAALSSPVATSAAANAAAVAVSDYTQPSPSASSERRRRHQVPPVAPPRTSSQQQPQQQQQQQSQQYYSSASAAPPSSSSSRRAAGPTAAASGSDSPRARARDSRDDSSRRRQQQEQEYAQRVAGGSSRSAAAGAATPIRSHANASQPSSHVPSRETSEILSSMLVSRDEVDIEREQARLALAHQESNATAAADDDDDDAAPPPVIPTAHPSEPHGDDGRRGGRSRHDHSRREKQIKFGEYILGNTIGEGEFGKVKLGWKQEGGVQVAIKLIKKDSLGSNPTRMAKIKREVNILRQLNHPNIVRLHKMEESEHHYGIVLEYASGGELFDYILNHRYLKDNAARRLFAQLISGVGYLHKKGIVHRDLKLENLLLDRHRNIIITDFGFANTFDPTEELTEDEEMNLSDRDWIKRMGYDLVKPDGTRKADLMQTSCGSPCYAAPELVVSDTLYTGRKVDVWSCGVILYAMLAGYLPFDDDPKNPEGDNINLLYKYIVNTPLTFPEYVTPHARDLLRRILVPNPRQRADLFEVARHSWLSEYASVVEFITSSTTSPADIQNIPATAEELDEGPTLGRSASVREASKKAVTSPTIGGLASKPGKIDVEAEAAAISKQQKDNKRRTVQVEYVAPTTQTQRGGEASGHQQAGGSTSGGGGGGKTRARSTSQGPIAVLGNNATGPAATEKPLPRDPPVARDAHGRPSRESRRPPSTHRTTGAAAALATTAAAGTAAAGGAAGSASRASRDGGRSVSEAAFMTASGPGGGRPATGGSMPNRASFGQPVPPTVAGTNAHGRIQQPKGNSSSAHSYAVSNQVPQDTSSFGRPSISVPPKFAQVSGFNDGDGDGTNEQAGAGQGAISSGAGRGHGGDVKGHRRSNTISDFTDKLLGRSGSIFGGKGRSKRPDQQQPQQQQQQQQQQPRQSIALEKSAARRYPPVSMANNPALQGAIAADEPRSSMDSSARQSRRSLSIALGKKRSGSIEAGSMTSQEKRQHARRFSLLPASFSLKSIGIGKDYPYDSRGDSNGGGGGGGGGGGPDSQADLPIQEPGGGVGLDHDHFVDQGYGHFDEAPQQQQAARPTQPNVAATQYQQRQPQYQPPPQRPQQPQHQRHVSASQFERHRPSALQEVTDNVQRNPPRSAPYQGDVDDGRRGGNNANRGGRGVLQKNKRMVDAYDTDEFSSKHDRSGSTGAARRVMDFFRRRSKARGGED